TENGLQVLTSLEGRSEESVARARAAGMTDASPDQIAAADLILSIVPPGDALSLAKRLAPPLARGNRKPAYVDCNAVNPKTVAGIEAAIAPTACPFVDAGIVGGPAQAGNRGPHVLRFRRRGAALCRAQRLRPRRARARRRRWR